MVAGKEENRRKQAGSRAGESGHLFGLALPRHRASGVQVLQASNFTKTKQ